MHQRIYISLLSALLSLSLVACGKGDGDASQQTALIRTVALQKHQLDELVRANGFFTPVNEGLVNVSFPQPVQITQIIANVGQAISKGAPLAKVNIDPSVSLAYRQAVLDRNLAIANLKQTERLLRDQLATQSQMDAAQKAVASAEAALAVQQEQGNSLSQQELFAPCNSIVLAITASNSDRVAAGVPILQLANLDHLSVRLGVEPAQSLKIKVGMPVRLNSVDDSGMHFSGLVEVVGSAIDPTSRLIPVVVDLSNPQQPSNSRIIPGAALSGEIILKTVTTWAVPRSAVLKDEKGSYLYQVKEAHARQVEVVTGLQNQHWIQVKGDLNPQQRVVVLGNYELEDGMAVVEEKTP